MALHRGRLDLLQEHLDRDPSLLERRFTYGEVFAVETRRRAGRCLSRDARVRRHAPAPGPRVRRHRRGALADRARGGRERPRRSTPRASAGTRRCSTPSSTWPRRWAGTTTRRRGSSSTMGPIPTPGRPSRRRPSSTATPPPNALHDVTPVGYARRYPDRRCRERPGDRGDRGTRRHGIAADARSRPPTGHLSELAAGFDFKPTVFTAMTR